MAAELAEKVDAISLASSEPAGMSPVATSEVPVENPDIDDEKDEDEVVVLLCILNQDPKILQGRKIWRRIVVPSEFSLMELHVALQNTFEWENMHLHNFQQPRKMPEVKLPKFSGFGTTDIASATTLDVDNLKPAEMRVFQSVIGIKDAVGEDFLTPATKEEGESEEEAVVFVQHSKEDMSDPASEAKEVLEERAFLVKDVLNEKNPALLYEYDFTISNEVTILFEGTYLATEGVNYPTCLAGQGASIAEDGNDMDEEGNLLPSYSYDEFSVLEVIANYTDTYIDSWPLGPGAEDNTEISRCYMCRYNRECGRRRECNGSCCDYCLKSDYYASAWALSLEDADGLFYKAITKVQE